MLVHQRVYNDNIRDARKKNKAMVCSFLSIGLSSRSPMSSKGMKSGVHDAIVILRSMLVRLNGGNTGNLVEAGWTLQIACNNVLLVKIEGPVWYTIYHHLPVKGGFFKPLY